MKGHQPSNTYRYLYNNIIGQLLKSGEYRDVFPLFLFESQ